MVRFADALDVILEDNHAPMIIVMKRGTKIPVNHYRVIETRPHWNTASRTIIVAGIGAGENVIKRYRGIKYLPITYELRDFYKLRKDPQKEHGVVTVCKFSKVITMNPQNVAYVLKNIDGQMVQTSL